MRRDDDNTPTVKQSLLLTRGVFLVLLQDSEPPVQAVVGDGRPVVPPGAVVVQDPPPLPLQRGGTRPGRRRRVQPGEVEDRRCGSGQEGEQQLAHFDYKEAPSPVNRLLHLLLTSAAK